MEINKIYNENCLETMAKMPDKFVDLVVTSPPYNMRTRIRNGQYTTREKSEHFSKKYKHFDDALPINDFYEFHSSVLTELLRVSKIVCYNFQIVTGSKEAFFKIIGDFNKDIKDIIIWDKGSGQPAINAFSEKEALIYDPFMGSGTTGLVASKLGRNYIGSEITEEYCKIAETRIKECANKTKSCLTE